MKRILAISLSLAMVFALFGAMAVSVSAETVNQTLYSFEEGTVGSGTNVTTYGNCKVFKVSSEQAYAGSKSLKVTPGTALWSNIGNFVNTTNAKSGAVFVIPKGLNITGSVGFYVYKNAVSASSYEAVGVKMNNGDMYFTKYANIVAQKTTWTRVELTGRTMYKQTDSSVSIKLNADNFADTADDANRVQKIIYLQAGASDDWNYIYIDKVFYQTTAAPSDPTIEMASGAAMRIDGDTDGIRFEATVDKTAFDALVSENATVDEIGTLIAKAGTDISKVVVENAVDTSTGAMELAEGKIPVAKYAAGTTMQDVAGTDKYVIYGSLVEIKDTNANQQYVARAYVKYTDSTGSHVLYASALSEARSIAQVAKAIVDANDSYYTSLCKDHKAVVNYWADQYVAA